MFKITFLIILMGLAPAVAFASPPRALPEANFYDFEDELVRGNLVRPDGEILRVRRRGDRESLVRARDHYIDRLLTSIENL